MIEAKKKVLVSNDDGIHAEGLANLCNSLHSIGMEVFVCAPDRERSAASHSLTMYSPLRVHEIKEPDFSASKAWTVDGTPADCVKVALELLMKPESPDYVVSGINRGPNLGTDILYSGTVAAAAEGCFAGIPSMAISCTAKRKPNYNMASIFVKKHLEDLFRLGLPTGTMLNVNVPPDAREEGRGLALKYARAGTMKYEDIFDVRDDPRGRQYIWMSGEPVDVDEDEDFDTVAIKKGFVTVTPVRFEVTDFDFLDVLRNTKSR
ncbi:MAG TPA: 5'/3'-nucleotidase SurE [Bacillota bacterium]|nr:5'/3'-nucleotidase SurE [Bacillota bacterium]